MGTKPQTTSEPPKSSIAVIGMGCIYPGAHSPEELWENVLAGRRFFRKAPKERLPREYFDSDPLAPGKSYCDQMAVIEGWQFDPVEFRIPPVAFHASDLAHWLALYTARAAVRDAGLNLQAIDRASVACRNRIDWIVSQIIPLIEVNPERKIRILDLGIGGAPIETRLIKLLPGALLKISAVDIESKALEFVSKTLRSDTCQVQTYRLDLRQESSARQVATLAQSVDVCFAVGILEALRDEDAERILRAIRQSLPKRGVLYAENFVPDHPNRKVMEWFMDFHLGYRSADLLRALAVKAGFDTSLVEVNVEATGSIALLKATL